MGLRAGRVLLGACFRGGQAVGFRESSGSPSMSPCALGATPGNPSSSSHPRKLGRCLSLGWGGAHGDAVRFWSPLDICTASCGPASLWCPVPCAGAAGRGPVAGGCQRRGDARLALELPGLGPWLWDRHQHTGQSGMSARGRDAGALPWGSEGLWRGGCRSRSPGTGRLSPQPCALPRSGFPRQAAHETSLVSNCCAPPFIIIDSASP